MAPRITREIPFGRPMIGEAERAAALEALNSPQLVHGPRATAFEKAFAERLGPAAHATSVSSCTAGLHLIYMHLGIGPGDEVIVPAQTHVATAHAVEITGARPVFVDCALDGNIDVSQVADSITERTRAICVVHFPGLPVEMAAIRRIADSRDLFIVEDCALAIGASFEGTPCGLLGDAASFSFYPVKHMTTAEGGMVVSRHADVTASVANLKAFGYDKGPHDRQIPGVYDVARLGVNYRMNEVSAAIGLVQVGRLEGFAQARNANAAILRDKLASVSALTLLPDGDARKTHANYCLVALLPDELAGRRNELLAQLRDDGIVLSVHYPVPVPLSAFYRQRYGFSEGEFPRAETISAMSIALPVGPHLQAEDMDLLGDKLIEAVGRLSE